MKKLDDLLADLNIRGIEHAARNAELEAAVAAARIAHETVQLIHEAYDRARKAYDAAAEAVRQHHTHEQPQASVSGGGSAIWSLASKLVGG